MTLIRVFMVKIGSQRWKGRVNKLFTTDYAQRSRETVHMNIWKFEKYKKNPWLH